VDHLRKRLRQAELEYQRCCRTVEATEVDIDKLQARIKVEVEERDDASDRVDDLRIELHNAEQELPPPAGVKPVGRQVPTGNQGAKEMLHSLKALLTRARRVER
jgi:hypothetical protein